MTDYDFQSLNDKEFEALAIDLVSKRNKTKFERFKPGRDAGVDGRYFKKDGSEVVVQCKHWPSSSLDKLIRYLETHELPKIKRLLPSRYIIALSHPLSRREKDRIRLALSPFILSPSDVIGREDLNDLLSENSETEVRHYKLWITSSNVLAHLLNKPIYDRSASKLKEIHENSYLYVPTSNHSEALDKLENLGTVIITGPAGIGKTTLADQLTLHYVTKGFTFVQIAEEIREAEAAYQTDELQLFYFDDFLGRNYLEALSGHEGTHISQFIKRITRDKKKRFILTSRTTILNQGKILIDVFHNNNLERNEFEISFDSLSEIDKAQILYNHIWHSSLEQEYIDQLYINKRYRKIISHLNFNPRLIRYITDSNRLVQCTPDQYWPYIERLLNNPAEVWQNPFDAQHDDFGRALIFLVTLNARPVSQGELAESFSRLVSHQDANAMHGRRDYMQSLRHLVGSMLSRTIISDLEPLINLFSPSIGDFVLYRYASDIPSLRAGFCSLRSTSSLNTLFNLYNNQLISWESRTVILDAVLDNAKAHNYQAFTAEYIASALVNYSSDINSLSIYAQRLTAASDFVARTACSGYSGDIANVMGWRLRNSMSTSQEVVDFIVNACELNPASSELLQIAALLRILPQDHAARVRTYVEEAASNYFIDVVHDEFPDDEVFDSVDPDQTYEAERNLSRMVESKMEKLGLSGSDAAVEAIVEAFDVSTRMDEYFRPEPEYPGKRILFTPPFIDAIDDLFERDD
ncbi:restriction endonuclease [Alcaligenaceae bacterium A4P071]|nr:restriction endonuclease [Alcaligenaceae bacterium A4P071]